MKAVSAYVPSSSMLFRSSSALNQCLISYLRLLTGQLRYGLTSEHCSRGRCMPFPSSLSATINLKYVTRQYCILCRGRPQAWSQEAGQAIRSAPFLAEISVRSPRKLLIFVIFKKSKKIWIKASKKCFV